MTRPRLLDLFCGAGGAAMGYHRAGFEVVGVDLAPTAYSIMRNLPWLRDREYWDSIPPTRAALVAIDKPYVMENVVGAPVDGIFLCGTMFGLRQPDGGPEYRHRLFESSVFMLAPGHPKHFETVVPGPMLGRRQDRLSGIGNSDQWRSRSLDNSGNGTADRQKWGQALGIDWMRNADLSQAIPPAYTEWIGAQLLASLQVAA